MKKLNIIFWGMASLLLFVVVCVVPPPLFIITQIINNLINQAARLAAFQRRVDALAVSIVFSAGLEQVIAVVFLCVGENFSLKSNTNSY